jgi:sugar phosphate permease
LANPIKAALGNRWGRLIPVAFITYSLAYVDRANYSFGAAAGMAHDLNITEGAGSLLGALFFLGYFFFQIPAARYAETRSAKKIILASLVVWGILATATGLAQRVEAILAEEQRSIPELGSYGSAFAKPVVLLLVIQYFCWSVGVYGFVLWLPSMLKTAGSIGIVEVGWLSSAPYLLAAILMVLASFASDRLGTRKPFIWPFLLIAAVAFYGSYLLGGDHYWLSFVLLIIAGGAMYAPYGPFFALIQELLPRNVAGAATALINGFGALGSFVGSYAVGWLNGTTGNANLSYLLMAGSLLLSSVLMLLVHRNHASAA